MLFVLFVSFVDKREPLKTPKTQSIEKLYLLYALRLCSLVGDLNAGKLEHLFARVDHRERILAAETSPAKAVRVAAGGAEQAIH